MNILILHRIPYHKINYHRGIDHALHDVTYVGTKTALGTLPAELRCRKVERPGVGKVADEVIEAVRKDPRPDLVISLSEYELMDAARVREALGVAGPTCAEVELVRNKVKMKAAVEARGIRVPRFQPLVDALNGQASPWEGRTVLKPVSGASSENVSVHASPAAVLAAARAPESPVHKTGPEQFQLEEFVEGPIIHVDGLVQDGRLAVVLASRYVGTCLGFAQGTPLGSVQIDTTEELKTWAARCLEAVAIRSGSFHLEGILSPTGPVFLEVAARVGGADVVDTFELATGVHMPSAELAYMVGAAKEFKTASTTAGTMPKFGWFVFPGHTVGGTHCRVSGAEQFQRNPLVVRWNQLTPDRPLPKNITYQAVEVPVAGVLGPGSTEQLERMMLEMFATIRVDPAQDAVLSGAA